MNFLHFDAGLRAGRSGDRRRRRQDRRARRFARIAPQADSCSASGPSTSASPTRRRLRGAVFGAEYLGTTQIVTVETAHGASRRALPSEPRRCDRRDRRPRASAPNACRCSTPAAGRRIPTALHEGARAMAEVALTQCQQALRPGRGGRATFRFAIADGEFVVLLGPDRRRQDHDAAADRRAGAARSRHRSLIDGRDVTDDAAGDRATSPSSSSNIRSIRT